MHIKILGVHKLESQDTRPTCFLLDGVEHRRRKYGNCLAGQGTGQIEAILISHRHFDQIRDLPTSGLAIVGGDRPFHLNSFRKSYRRPYARSTERSRCCNHH